MIECYNKMVLTFDKGDLRGSSTISEDTAVAWFGEAEPHKPGFLTDSEPVTYDEIERAPLVLVFKNKESLRVLAAFFQKLSDAWDKMDKEE